MLLAATCIRAYSKAQVRNGNHKSAYMQYVRYCGDSDSDVRTYGPSVIKHSILNNPDKCLGPTSSRNLLSSAYEFLTQGEEGGRSEKEAKETGFL